MTQQPETLPPVIEPQASQKIAPSQSPPLQLETVAEERWDLGWLFMVVRRRAPVMIGVALSMTGLAGGLFLLMTRSRAAVYAGKFQLLVEPITAEEQQARSSTRAQGAAVPERIDIERSSLDYESQIRILQGPRLLEPVVEQVRQRYSEVTYDTLSESLKIGRITYLTSDKKEQGTKLIEVSYQDTNPDKIKFILEQVSQAYLKYSLKERQSSIRRGIQFIDGQLPPLRKRVDTLQQQIQTLRRQYGIVDPDQQSKQLAETIGKLNEASADNQARLAEAQTKREKLARQLADASPQSVLGEVGYYQPLLSQYQQLMGQIAIESARLESDNPAMQALLDKQRNLEAVLNQAADQVVEKAQDSVAIAQARRQAIEQAQTTLEQKVQQLPEISRRYTDLQRELALAADSLNKFASRREALQIDAAQQEVPWELTLEPRLDRNSAGKPIQVNTISKARFLMLIAVLSMLLGVGVGFLMEASQDLLRTQDDIKRATRLGLLGVIPHNDAQFPAISGAMIEALRSLAKNFRLLSHRQGAIRSLMVTSAEVGDGKTTIALQLAMTAARMQQRVLLVDADLHYPQIHSLLGLSNPHGLSDLLLDDLDLEKVTQSLPEQGNLTVLTAGQSAFDPAELWTTPRLGTLFQTWQSQFDLVIVDAPPLLGSAHSSLIAAQCDSLALVVRFSKTRRASIVAALEELKFLPTRVLGAIANDAPKASARSDNHRNRLQ